MSESVFRVHDQLLVFGAFLCVIRYFHTALLATLQSSHTGVCVCVWVCTLCHTSARAAVFRCYPSGTTLPLSDLSCTENRVCRGQRSFAFFEASEALPQAKMLLSVRYYRAFFPSLQDRSSKSVGKQAKMLLRKKEAKHSWAGKNIWMTVIQQTLDGVNGRWILILGPAVRESANGCVLALFLNIPFDLYLAFRITTVKWVAQDQSIKLDAWKQPLHLK